MRKLPLLKHQQKLQQNLQLSDMPDKAHRIAKALIRKGYPTEKAWKIANSKASQEDFDDFDDDQLASMAIMRFRMERDMEELLGQHGLMDGDDPDVIVDNMNAGKK